MSTTTTTAAAETYHAEITSLVGVYALGAAVISVAQMRDTVRVLQRASSPSSAVILAATVRVLGMVPIYALASLASLVWLDAAPLIDLIRDAYEAYVLYAFVCMALAYAGGVDGAVEMLGASGAKGSHSLPLSLIYPSPFDYSSTALNTMVLSVTQYMYVKPAMAAVALIGTYAGVYDEAAHGLDELATYVSAINVVSSTVAVTGLLYMYLALRDPLHHIGLTPKILGIKAAVMATFWQGIVLAAAGHWDLLPHSAKYSLENLEIGIQDALVCVEILAVALGFSYAYSNVSELVPPTAKPSRSHIAAWVCAFTTSLTLPPGHTTPAVPHPHSD